MYMGSNPIISVRGCSLVVKRLLQEQVSPQGELRARKGPSIPLYRDILRGAHGRTGQGRQGSAFAGRVAPGLKLGGSGMAHPSQARA